jgi:NitT/TauT family transport system substrate-binding protein
MCAQAQGMYWFLVMRSDLAAARNDLSVVKGRRIGAAPWVDMGLKRLLEQSGLDLEKDAISIAPVAPNLSTGVNFGLTAAKALEDGKIDGFWANGMGAEVVRSGVGTVVVDVRRGDGPASAFDYTFASIAATDAFIHRAPEAAAAFVRAIVNAQKALKQDVTLATRIGDKLFPKQAAELIEALIRRDLPFYEASITDTAVKGMNASPATCGFWRGNRSTRTSWPPSFRACGRSDAWLHGW